MGGIEMVEERGEWELGGLLMWIWIIILRERNITTYKLLKVFMAVWLEGCFPCHPRANNAPTNDTSLSLPLEYPLTPHHSPQDSTSPTDSSLQVYISNKMTYPGNHQIFKVFVLHFEPMLRGDKRALVDARGRARTQRKSRWLSGL